MIYAIFDSPLGPILLFSEDGFLTGAYLPEQKPELPAHAVECPNAPVIQQAMQLLDAYFSGKQPSPTLLPLRPRGSSFQEKVWQRLLQISYGETVTYSQIAKDFPGIMSAQAVGQAVGKNPISIIIPCHRVLGANNRLTGYAGGIECKAWLLEHEGLDHANFIYPKKYREM